VARHASGRDSPGVKFPAQNRPGKVSVGKEREKSGTRGTGAPPRVAAVVVGVQEGLEQPLLCVGRALRGVTADFVSAQQGTAHPAGGKG
jgi:hypothetical protein